MRLYHTTSAAAAQSILRDGFREHSGSYGLFVMTLTGVFISNRPLGPAEGCRGDPDFGDPVLVLEIPEHELDPDTELQEGLGYREWCISAKLANRYILCVITEPEEVADREDWWSDMQPVRPWDAPGAGALSSPAAPPSRTR